MRIRVRARSSRRNRRGYLRRRRRGAELAVRAGRLGAGRGAPDAANCSPWPRRTARRPTSFRCSGRTKRDAVAVAACAAGAADAMDVVVVALRRVEVDHVRDVVDVETAGGDVGRDERRDAAGLELRERALALVLREVAVHRDAPGSGAGARASARACPRRASSARRRARARGRPGGARRAGRACSRR